MKGDATVIDPRERRPARPDESRPHSRRSLPAWGVYLLVVVPLIAAYPFMPNTLLYSILYDVIALSCLAAILVGVRINKPADTLPWYLLALGVTFWLLGDLLFTYFEHVAHSTPFPSIADALYLGAYGFFAPGIYLIVRKQRSKHDRSLLIDAMIITIGAAVLVWMFLMEPYANDKALTLWEKLVSMAYPIADVLALSVLVRVFLGTRSRSIAHLLLVSGLLLTIASDSAYGLMLLKGTYFPGHLVDYGWLLFYGLWGLSALHPSMAAVSLPEGRRRRAATPWRLTLMAVVAILAPTIALIQLANGDRAQLFVVTATSVIIFLLVILRMGGVLSRLETAHTKVRRMEREKGKLLDRTMQVGEEERVRVATELHDGPIHQLSAVAYRFEAAMLQLQRGDHESAGVALAKVRDSFGQEIDTLRKMMAELRPPELDDRGLKTALQDQLAAFQESSGIHGTLTITGENPLPREIETGLFRIAHEALANVAKHSAARNVRLELQHGALDSLLTIADDGTGFDPSGITTDLADGRFGLISMRQHIEALGGRFAVTSSGAGTVITARFTTEVETLPDPGLASLS
jgi:signal transduction histidine kinase